MISSHEVSYFSNILCCAGNYFSSSVEEVIPKLVDAKMNNILTMLPSRDEIKKAVFNLNKSGALGPDGFGGHFF